MSKVGGLAKHTFQRMSGRQHAERTHQIPNFSFGGMDTDPSAELLQHIDAGPSVRCVHHQMHRSVWFENVAQSSEASIRVGEMMENPSAHDLIEAHLKLAYLLDGELVHLQIFQVMFSLELLGV